ncbi:hypothetical protein ACP4OV_028508 [Aristida adscensionis]
MTGNASYQQFGVDAMMNSCFVSGSGGGGVVGADAFVFHVPEYALHDGGVGFGFGEPSEVATRFLADDGAALAGQLQLVRATVAPQGVAPEETRGAYDVVAGESCGAAHSALPAAPLYGQWPSDVTVAHPSQCSWNNEPWYPTWFSGGGGFSDPFAVATSGLPRRLRAGSSSAGTANVSMADQSSEVSCSGLTHASSNPGHGLFQPSYGGAAGVGDELRQMARPGPPHFSQVLARSGYAHIAQQTLDEFVGCLLQDVAGVTGSVGGGGGGVSGEASCLLLPSSSCSKTTTPSNQSMLHGSEENAHQNKLRNDLLKLLQLMDQRCNQCLDEIQSAASKYGGMVHPGGDGALAVPFAHQAVSAMHRRLRARIMGAMAAATRRAESSSSSLTDRERSWESAFIQKHWALRQLRRGDQQSWRPQRGLPEKSVAVLKAWMFENFLRPYPKDNEKEMLAARSGLSRSQVSNWFINARVRLWKPMIEEMYEDLKKASGDSEGVSVV